MYSTTAKEMHSVEKKKPVWVIVVGFSACSSESRQLSWEGVEGLALVFDMPPSVPPLPSKDAGDVEGE